MSRKDGGGGGRGCKLGAAGKKDFAYKSRASASTAASGKESHAGRVEKHAVVDPSIRSQLHKQTSAATCVTFALWCISWQNALAARTAEVRVASSNSQGNRRTV